MTSFAEQIAAFNRKCEKRLNSAAKLATQATVEEMNTPQGKGGRLPVDTGFLRSSIAAAIDRMPSGTTKPETKGDVIAGDAVAPVLLRWNPADEVIYVGYLAEYATVQEYHNGFLRGAVENWDQNVKEASAEAQRRIP